MSKRPIEFSNIAAARNRADEAAQKLSKCEADIVIAERNFDQARRDDGISKPEEIYNRSEAARRELEILKIEGNRAAAKLAEAEDEFARLVRDSAMQILATLEDKARAARERITADAARVLGEEACKTPEFNTLLWNIPEVSVLRGISNRIQMSITTDPNRDKGGPLPGDLIANIMSAGEFL